MQSSGAHNNEAFRQTINISQKVDLSSFNSQGIFNEYYFDTGLQETKEIFEANFTFAHLENILTNQEEQYIGIGINCKNDGKNLRSNLDLFILVDISGSMNQEIPLTDENKSEYKGKQSLPKISLAKDVLSNLVYSLKKEDSLGIGLFNNKFQIFQQLQYISQIKQKQLIENIQVNQMIFYNVLKGIQAKQGTNMELALKETFLIFQNQHKDKKIKINNEKRVIFITDAQPNCGNNKESLIDLTKQFAQENIYITYIGVGLDFNIQLTEELTKIRGCNFFSVHTASQFQKILLENFNYLMTPQVFNTQVEFESQNFSIAQTYGTNFRDQNSKQFFIIETIMAGDKKNNQIKGGIILLKLKKNQKIIQLNDSQQDKFVITYEIATTGEKIRKSETFNLSQLFYEMPLNSYSNFGIRKAVSLAIYSDFIESKLKEIQLNYDQLVQLIKYLENEAKEMKAEDLFKEIELLEKLKKCNI